MKELQSVLKFFNSFTGGHYAERHCMHDYKISIKWKQQIFIKFFSKKKQTIRYMPVYYTYYYKICNNK